MKTLFLQTRHACPDGTYDTFHTQRLESRESPLPWQLAGLSWTATGYGKRIPTGHMVRFNGKWRRVYCCQYSNVGTCYIGKLSDGLIITEG